MVRRTIRVIILFMVLSAVAGSICGMRWVLGSDDLAAFAKPAGYHEIAHRSECGGTGGDCGFLGHWCEAYCSNDWVYVSDDKSYEETIVELADRYTVSGWMVRGCGAGEFVPVKPSDPCGMGAIRRAADTGRWVECYWYSDFKGDAKFRDDWRRGFQSQIDRARSVILVTTSCG